MQFHLAFSILAEQIRRYAQAEEDDLELIKKHFQLEEASKKSILTRLGQIERRIYFFSDGVARAWFECDGEDRTAAFIYRGFWGTSFESFLAEKESPYEIEVLADAQVLWISRDRLNELLELSPVFSSYYRKIMEQAIVGMQFRERELLSSDAKSRFERFMQQSAFLLRVVPQKQLASYLNMTPETFSRLRRSWMETS